MTILRLWLLALVALVGLVAPAAAPAQAPDIVVRADAARAEIERILDADNLDTGRLSPREVADTIAAIARGNAPEDFWNAYRLHVQAWQALASAVERAQGGNGESAFAEERDALAQAEAAIGTTFDEVERIARSYHARLPHPPVDTRAIA